jgi:hypothetical protein
MNILEKFSEKIEEIQKQPENIRIRYVWGSVAISMLVVIAIWIFSMGSLFQGDKNQATQSVDSAPSITKQLEELKKQAPSLKDFSEESLNVENEGVVIPQNSNSIQTPAAVDETEAVQADAYSNLSETLPTR